MFQVSRTVVPCGNWRVVFLSSLDRRATMRRGPEEVVTVIAVGRATTCGERHRRRVQLSKWDGTNVIMSFWSKIRGTSDWFYHLSSLTCCYRGNQNPLFINQPVEIWDIYGWDGLNQFERSNLPVSSAHHPLDARNRSE